MSRYTRPVRRSFAFSALVRAAPGAGAGRDSRRCSSSRSARSSPAWSSARRRRAAPMKRARILRRRVGARRLRRMHGLLTPDGAAAHVAASASTRAYRRAAVTATLAERQPGRAAALADGVVRVPVRLRTRIFGASTARSAARRQRGRRAGVDWSARLVVPRPARGREPARARPGCRRARTIQARDGTVIAEGDARAHRARPLASRDRRPGRARAAGARRRARRARRAGGRAGGAQRARARVRRRADRHPRRHAARRRPRARPRRAARRQRRADDDRSRRPARRGRRRSAAASAAIAVLRPRDGEVLALAGHRLLRAAAARLGVQDHHAGRRARGRRGQAVEPLPGRRRRRRSRASSSRTPTARRAAARCGSAFAESCNSVFAPLGAELGRRAPRATAERFGFNADPGLAGAARSTIPRRGEIGDYLAVGSTAIGQGEVLATPLEMATVAAAIAERRRAAAPDAAQGRRAGGHPRDAARRRAHGRPLHARRRARPAPASAPRSRASGSRARPARPSCATRPRPTRARRPRAAPPGGRPTDTDAWFAAFAPARRPRVAVAVLLVGAGRRRRDRGAGGEAGAGGGAQVTRYRSSREVVATARAARSAARAGGCGASEVELEQQQRALDRAVGRGRVGGGISSPAGIVPGT